MMRDRGRAGGALAAGCAGLIVGIVVTVAVQGAAPAQQSPDRRRVIRPEKSPNTGLPFSPGIRVGGTLYVSGHLGRDPGTAQLVRGGIEAETRQALTNVREVLRTAGMDFRDVASVTAYITTFEDFAKFNAGVSRVLPERSAGESHRAGRGAERRRADRVADDRGQAITADACRSSRMTVR